MPWPLPRSPAPEPGAGGQRLSDRRGRRAPARRPRSSLVNMRTLNDGLRCCCKACVAAAAAAEAEAEVVVAVDHGLPWSKVVVRFLSLTWTLVRHKVRVVHGRPQRRAEGKDRRHQTTGGLGLQ